MEIRLANRLRRTEQSARMDGTKKDFLAAESSSSDTRPQTDRLTVARQAVAQLEEQSQRLAELLEQSAQGQRKALWETDEAESGDAELEAMSKRLKVMRKCQEIAARIMRGDKVPPEDEQYLMQNDPAGYKLAMVTRKPKKDPKEWESILDDEDKSAGDGGEEETAEASSCGESGGASDAGGSGASGE